MSSFNTTTEKTKIEVSDRPDGSVSVKTTPKDFLADGAAEVVIDRPQRGDDGSVEIIISPKKPPIRSDED